MSELHVHDLNHLNPGVERVAHMTAAVAALSTHAACSNFIPAD